ncbi:MbtH family protein [Streptomyces iakyrus]|uniref:MbtH family protein n=1 Tax=Streptomyces iakyrus TaxID=68219 RepID=UPI0036EF78DE
MTDTPATAANPELRTNPFEDDTARYLVVVNDEDQHALWPAELAVPAGWRTVLDAAPRSRCLAYVESHWTDMRPASVRDSA